MGCRILHKNPSSSLRGIKRVDREHVFSRKPSRAKGTERKSEIQGFPGGDIRWGTGSQVEHGHLEQG